MCKIVTMKIGIVPLKLSVATAQHYRNWQAVQCVSFCSCLSHCIINVNPLSKSELHTASYKYNKLDQCCIQIK